MFQNLRGLYKGFDINQNLYIGVATPQWYSLGECMVDSWSVASNYDGYIDSIKLNKY